MTLTPQAVLLGQYDHLIDITRDISLLIETLKSQESYNTFTLDLFCAFLQRRENILLAQRGNIEFRHSCGNKNLVSQSLPIPPLLFHGSTVAMRFAWLLERGMKIPWDWWQNIGIHGGVTALSIINMLSEVKKIGKWPHQLPGCVWGYLLHGVLVGAQYDGAEGAAVTCCDAEAKVGNNTDVQAHSSSFAVDNQGTGGRERVGRSGNEGDEEHREKETVGTGGDTGAVTDIVANEHQVHGNEDAREADPGNMLIHGKYKSKIAEGEEKEGIWKRARLTDSNIRHNTRKKTEHGIPEQLNLNTLSGQLSQSHAGSDMNKANSATIANHAHTHTHAHAHTHTHTGTPTSRRLASLGHPHRTSAGTSVGTGMTHKNMISGRHEPSKAITGDTDGAVRAAVTPHSIAHDDTHTTTDTTHSSSTLTSAHNTHVNTSTATRNTTPVTGHTATGTQPLSTPAASTSIAPLRRLVSVREKTYGDEISGSCPCRACVASHLVLSGAVTETQWHVHTQPSTGRGFKATLSHDLIAKLSANPEHQPILTMMDVIVSQTAVFASTYPWHYTLFRQLMDKIPINDRNVVYREARAKGSTNVMWYSLIKRYLREGGSIGQWEIMEFGKDNFPKRIRDMGEILYERRVKHETNTTDLENISTGLMPVVVCGDVETVAVVTEALIINPIYFAAIGGTATRAATSHVSTGQRMNVQWAASLPNEYTLRTAMEGESEEEPEKAAFLRHMAIVVAKDWLRREMGVPIPISQPRRDRETVASTGIEGPTTRTSATMQGGKAVVEGCLLTHVLHNVAVLKVILEALREMCDVPVIPPLPEASIAEE